MLLSECCSNYICHCCVDDLQMQERKDDKFVAACPYGCHHQKNGALDGTKKFNLGDVDPNEKIKKYSDSQNQSFYSSIQAPAPNLKETY